MQKRRDRKRAGIIKRSCIVAAVTFFVSACALDSLTWVPSILCCVSVAWLALVGMANDRKLHRCNREEKHDRRNHIRSAEQNPGMGIDSAI